MRPWQVLKGQRVRTGLQTGPEVVTVHRANENFQCMTAAAKVNSSLPNKSV